MSLGKTLGKHATTLVLCGLAIAAGAVVFVVDRGSVTTDEAAARKKNLFVAWHAEEIESVTIERDGKTGTISRVDKPDEHGQRGWQITIGGDHFPAEEQRVDQLLGTLELGTSERVLAPGSVDAAALGLDVPRVRVRVTMNGRASTLEIGGPASSPKGASHAAVDEGRGRVLHVVNAELVSAIDVDPESLRSRRLVPWNTNEIGRVDLERAGRTYGLERPSGRLHELRLTGSSHFAGLRASREKADALLSSLARAEADVFLTDDAATRASSPKLTITVAPKADASTRAELTLGGECPDKPDSIVVIQKSGPGRVNGCVPRDTLDALDVAEEGLVDTGGFFATIDELEDISIGSSLELARKGSGFHVRKPEEKDIEGDAGRTLLEPMLALRATSVAKEGDKHALGLDPPREKIRLVSLHPARGEDGGDDELVEELLLGEPKGDTLPALRVSDGAILSFALPAARAFFPSKTALRSPVVIDAPETAVKSIRVKEGERVQHIERTPEGGWKLLEPNEKGLAADIGLGTDLAAALCPLRVERFVADHDDGSFGLERPRYVIDLDLGGKADAGARTVKLLVGAPTDRGSFARIEGDDAVFVIDRKVESAAGLWLLDRAPFSFDLGDVVKVTIAARASKSPPVILERAKGALRIASDPNDTARAANIRDALSDLVPEGAVSVGPPRKDQGLDPPAVTLTIEREAIDAPDPKGAPTIDPSRTLRIFLGSGDAFRGTSITYARKDGIPATYAIPQSKTRILVESAR